MSTFIQWLKTQKKRDDPIGDLARDVVDDSCAPKAGSFYDLKRHLVNKHDVYDEMVLGALVEAHKEYVAC